MLQDYIFCRLMRSGLLAEGSSYSGDATGGKLSDVSRELQVIGSRLETVYPNLYQNVSRQVNIAIKVFDIYYEQSRLTCTDCSSYRPYITAPAQTIRHQHTSHACFKSCTPLVDGCVDDTLFNAVSSV